MSVKEQVLEILEQNRLCDISGEDMAKQLEVSRNSVWKAINALREEGYDILSSTNRGYRISADSDIISAQGILADMKNKMPVFAYKSTDSTNTRAKLYLAQNRCDRALFVAEEQTTGRGRLGRSFYSPYGTGIYMSYVFSPNSQIANAVSITSGAAVAVIRVLDRLNIAKPMIKWVNDIYINRKKVCGILTEAVTNYETGVVQHVIIGIGINYSTKNFPDELAGTATALGKQSPTRNTLIAQIADELYALSCDLNDRSYFETYRERMLVLGKRITYIENGKSYKAHAVDVDINGGLVVSDNDGNEKVLRSGEISVRL